LIDFKFLITVEDCQSTDHLFNVWSRSNDIFIDVLFYTTAYLGTFWRSKI